MEPPSELVMYITQIITMMIHILENNPKQIRVLIGLKWCFYNSMETELAQAVDVMMA